MQMKLVFLSVLLLVSGCSEEKMSTQTNVEISSSPGDQAAGLAKAADCSTAEKDLNKLIAKINSGSPGNSCNIDADCQINIISLNICPRPKSAFSNGYVKYIEGFYSQLTSLKNNIYRECGKVQCGWWNQSDITAACKNKVCASVEVGL